MLPLARQARHLGRYRQIAQVLGHHGFGYIVEQLGLVSLLSLPRRIILQRPPPVPLGVAERVRLVLVELGPTFIKLGQLLSTRPDLIPADLLAELDKLQDTVPSFPSEVAVATIEEELQQPLSALFRRFDMTPLAAASLGQVHAAVLYSGEHVVVKVQRPDIGHMINTDLAILTDLARLAQERNLFGEQYDLIGLAWEFSATLRDELDYYREGTNAERFRRNFAGSRLVHIPKIYWNYTSSRILTTERLFGVKINDIAGLDAAGINRPLLARNSLYLVLEEIFSHGFYHSDPHPGNFFALRGNIVGAIDFGQVGMLDREMTRQMLLLLSAFTQYDPEGALRAMERIGMFSRYNLTSALRRDVQRLINRFIDRPLKELSLHELGGALIDLTRRHRLHMPPPMAIIIKTLIMIEGTGVKIDPDLDVFALARPYAQRALAAQYTPGVVADRWFYSSRNVSETMLGLPQQVGEVLYRLETGDLKLQTQEQELPRLTGALMGAANRLAVALVLAGLLIGFGLVAVALDISQWNITILIVLGGVGGAVMLVLGLALAFALLRGRDV